MSDSLVTLKDVGVYYRGGRSKKRSPQTPEQPWALRHLSFEIRKGEKLGIVGRNGCGKSTLLRLLAGIIAPDEGKITFASKKLHVQLLALGVGFENHLSGAENAILSGLFMGKSRSYMDQHLATIQEFSELGDAFHRPVNTYSSGMTARLGFSIALQTDPDIFLIDEILGVGDHSFFQKSQAAIQAKLGPDTTVILIAHNASLITSICTRAIWMEKGQVLANGAPGEVCAYYEKCTTPAVLNEEYVEDGGASIHRVWLELENGTEIHEIQTDQRFNFCTEFIFNKDIDDPVLGFKAATSLGVVIFAANTEKLSIKTGPQKKGDRIIARWHLKVPLNPNWIFFSAGCSYPHSDKFLCRKLEILKTQVLGDIHQIGLLSAFDRTSESVSLSSITR